jgi:hypothetical protein
MSQSSFLILAYKSNSSLTLSWPCCLAIFTFKCLQLVYPVLYQQNISYPLISFGASRYLYRSSLASNSPLLIPTHPYSSRWINNVLKKAWELKRIVLTKSFPGIGLRITPSHSNIWGTCLKALVLLTFIRPYIQISYLIWALLLLLRYFVEMNV